MRRSLPTHCINYGDDGLRITDQDKCIGCGFCKLECKAGAVRIKQTMPMRASINEYHLNEARINDGKPHADVKPSTEHVHI